MTDHKIKQLIHAALYVRKNTYCPYSRFAVGAALLGENGRIYVGCNIENASYPAGNCAERSAVCAAVSDGERQFKAIAIVGGKEGEEPSDECPPCGICRQMLVEFCREDFPVILAVSEEKWRIVKLGELLPESFLSDGIEYRASKIRNYE